MDSFKIASFHEFIITAKKSSAKVVVIYSPVFKKIERNQEIQICSEICALENVPFLNFSNDTLFLNNGYLFQDMEHLNHNGAKIYSCLVVDKIKNNIYKTQSKMGGI